MRSNGSTEIFRIKTVKPTQEWQLFYVQNGKKWVMEYTFYFSQSSGREEFLGIGKIHQGKVIGSVAKYLPLISNSKDVS